MLISASEDEAMCDEHQKELQEIRYEKLENECTNCYTEEFDFEKCAEHNFYDVLLNSCEQCEVQKKLIKDFQIHNHTFTCKKKRKTITVRRNEGHGRLDGIVEAQKIPDYVECRFNFPQFPLNRTRFILGIPKDLSSEEL